MNKDRTKLLALLAHIQPLDSTEQLVATQAAEWVRSEAELYRLDYAGRPDPHLVVYCVLIDQHRKQILLMDHIKSGLWLPTGGHVEPEEDPRGAVLREMAEELGVSILQAAIPAAAPLFVTSTRVRGEHEHTDVSLWYVVHADATVTISPDPAEFRGYRWIDFDEVAEMKPSTLDVAMERFMRKLTAAWGNYSDA